MTFLFMVTWQFAPFALLLHSLVCFVLATLRIIEQKEVKKGFSTSLNLGRS